MDAIFRKLRDVIVELGSERAREGQLRLPTERELALQLGVQRSTLRERLSTLEHLGVLQRTQGSGTYISPLNSEFIQLYFDLALALGFIGIDEMETARELLEREIVHRAASVADTQDMDELEDLASRMERATTPTERLRADLQFHMRLAYAARNPVITLVFDGLASVLQRVLSRRRYLVRSVPGAAERMDATHRPIVDALRRRDPEQAMALMDRHFRVWDDLSSQVSSLYRTPGGDELAAAPSKEAIPPTRGPKKPRSTSKRLPTSDGASQRKAAGRAEQ